MEGTVMESILGSFTSVFSWFTTQIGTLIDLVVAEPLLLLMTAVMMTGAAVGMFIRFLKSM